MCSCTAWVKDFPLLLANVSNFYVSFLLSVCLSVCPSVCVQASFERDEAAVQKRVDALIMEIASFEQTMKLRSRQKVSVVDSGRRCR